MAMVQEPARRVPVVEECDICVIGGSTTGVFAAVAAARLGARVALVENLGFFGGTATASLVCIWHSDLDTRHEQTIIAGLVRETLDRVSEFGGLINHGPSESRHFVFQPYRLVLALDQLVVDAGVRPFLHTRFVAPVMDGGRVTHAVIEDKTGRRAIKAKVFVDASGDADLAHRAGLPTWTDTALQPPTTCAVFQGLGQFGESPSRLLQRTAFDPQYPEALPRGFLWGSHLPGDDMFMVAGTRVHNADCSDADQLTAAEIEGRRQVAAMLAILHRYVPGGEQVTLQGLPARIGIRQSRQVHCLHRLTEQEVLRGERFPDAIANGSYRVDIHFPDRDGLLFRYLDGREVTVYADGRHEPGRWLPEGEATASFYQIPYRCLVPQHSANVLIAGRCLDADRGAFGAVRVMVNAAQTGQAAGTAAHLAASAGVGVAEVDTGRLREVLAGEGAAVV